MSLSSFFLTSKNAKRILNTCISTIREYQSDQLPSCEDFLIEQLKSYFYYNGKEEIDTWDDSDTNYVEISNTTLANITYDILAGGNLNLAPGFLNPIGPGRNLIVVYKKCMQYALSNGFITEQEMNEEISNLYSCIRSAG